MAAEALARTFSVDDLTQLIAVLLNSQREKVA